MAFGRYGRRYRRYRKYRRFYRRYRRGYGRRFVNGSSRSTVRMKTVVTRTMPATAGYGTDGTGAVVTSILPLDASTNYLAAANSPLYRTYCSLYEECKMIGCKVNISVVSAVGGTDIPSLQIYTAWDRKHGYGEPAYTAQQIKDSSTYAVATALNNNVAKLTRSCYASDLIEKATWFDSSLNTASNNINSAWVAAALNPNMFCPAFFCFFNCPSLGATATVSISYSITYYFAFRNPRYGGSSAAKQLLEMESIDAPIAKSRPDDDDGDMDDAPGIQLFADGTHISVPDSGDAELDEERTSVTSLASSLSGAARRAGVPSAAVAAKANRIARDRLIRGGKNV